MYKKKGDITVSFSWIFMIIVGGFFIMIAYNIISVYQDNQEKKFEVELNNVLRNVFSLVGRTTGIEEDKIEPLGRVFRNSQVEIICHETGPILSINGKFNANNPFLKNYPTFMTYIKQGRLHETYLAVSNYRLPFKTANMLAIVSKNNIIVLDNSSDLTRDLLEKFGRLGAFQNLTIVHRNFLSIDHSEFSGSSVNSVMFVSEKEKPPNFLDSYNRQRAYYLKVEFDSGTNQKTGKLVYTDQINEISIFPFIDYGNTLSLITMALFSSPGTFRCSYEKLLEHTITSYDFYILKIESYLKMLEEGKLICSPTTSFPDVRFKQMKEMLEKIQNELEVYGFENREILYNKINAMEEYFKENLEVNNCPYIY